MIPLLHPPERPRTETAAYGQPRWPFRSPLPDLATAGDEEILNSCANCLQRSDDRMALRESDDHVVAVLRQVERLDTLAQQQADRIATLQSQLAVALGLGGAVRRQLDSLREAYGYALEGLASAQDQSASDRTMRVAALEERNRLADLHARVSAENTALRGGCVPGVLVAAQLLEIVRHRDWETLVDDRFDGSDR